MVRVKNVESYLMYEVVVTMEVFVGVLVGKIEHREEWILQVEKLKYAFHLFMLDLDVEDFKQLKVFKEVELPSEQREKEKGKSEEKIKVKAGARKVGKQLQLFFVNCKEVVVLTERKLFRILERRLLGNDQDYKAVE